MDKIILDHFKKNDQKLYAIIIKIGKMDRYLPKTSGNYFSDLCESITNQQLSGKAAATIWGRFVGLMEKGNVTPLHVLKVPEEKIRGAGMSWAKARYVRDLALKVKSKLVKLDQLDQLSDEEVIIELVKVKGIGSWTAEMFLMFTLGRENIFSYGDLGLRNGIKKVYNLDNPTKDQIGKLCKKWSPYKTYACRILWKSLEVL